MGRHTVVFQYNSRSSNEFFQETIRKFHRMKKGVIIEFLKTCLRHLVLLLSTVSSTLDCHE